MSSSEYLRLAAFVAYLAAWVVFAIGAIISGIPQIQRQAAAPVPLKAAVLIGIVLQIAPTFAFSLTLDDGPLRPKQFELMGILAFSIFGAAVFAAAILSAPRNAGPPALVTHGVYAWMRHPIYLALLSMLVATGLLVSAGSVLLIAIAIYVAGSELRIASEEEELSSTFHAEYEQYRRRTRWRYLPGLR